MSERVRRKVKRWPIALWSVAIAAVMVTGLSAQQVELRELLLVNESGFEMVDLTVTPAEGSWNSGDLLPGSTALRDGEALRITLHHSDRCGAFRLRAVDRDGDAYEVPSLLVCRQGENRVSLTVDYLIGPSEPAAPRALAVSNALPFDIYYIFLRPTGASVLGVDYLGPDATLERGRTLTLELSPSGGVLELLAIDEKGSRYLLPVEPGEERLRRTVDLRHLEEVER